MKESSTPQTPTENKTDAVDVRAAEIAKREGRDTIEDKDRKKAYEELKEMSPPVEDTKARNQ